MSAWSPNPLFSSRRSGMLALCLVLLLAPGLAQGQSRQLTRKQINQNISSLEEKQEQLEKDVKKTSQLLAETRGVKKKSFNELRLLKTKLKLQEELISNVSAQIEQADGEIGRLDGLVQAMERDVQRYQRSYAKAAQVAYKTRGELSSLLWILSSDGFRQAFHRIIYFQEFGRYRKNQIFLIQRTRSYLAQRKKEIETRKARKEELLAQRTKEKERLAKTRKEKNELLEKLQRNERTYAGRLNNYRKEIGKIRATIKELILESRKLMTREGAERLHQLSKTFESNKGKLPWPVNMNNGVVTGKFGKTITPTGGEVINDGVYISTNKGEKVRAIFDGEVTMISRVPMYGSVVIIQHGKYRSVYANLDNLLVKKGDQVSTLSPIGTVKTVTSTGETQIYFQLYKDFNPVNPAAWIADKH